MRAYLTHLRMNLRLTFRDKTVVFFNYLFPLIFFFMFAQLFHAEQGGLIIQVVSQVLSIGILGTGFFGAGMRAVMDREQNILRRFKVAPIGAGPIVVSSLITGLVNYMPVVGIVFLLSHFIYGMQVPENWLSALIFVSIGVLAFRALGVAIASVVNSQQESQILIQLLYFPMLMLSGAAIPMSILPRWVQIASQFLPSTHLFAGMQGIMTGRETLLGNTTPLLALLCTIAVGSFLAVKLFRWEKDEKLKASAKVWLLAVLAPFLLIGTYQAYSRDNLGRNKILERDMKRSRSTLFKDVRIFVGNGQVIETGAVLVRNGKIAQVFTGAAPDASLLKADAIEASGKTLLPGLIDTHVHLGAPGGFYQSQQDYKRETAMPRALAAYLYSGVTAVKSVGDAVDATLALKAKVNSGEKLGAELFAVGPMFTTEGGHGTEMLKYVPGNMRLMLEQQIVRLPKTADEARKQVDELKKKGVDGIKGILESGWPGTPFNRMDVALLRAVAGEAHAQQLPIVIHTGDVRDVEDAVAMNANGIEHGSFREAIPENLFEAMKKAGVTYDPTLVVVEAFGAVTGHRADPLDRTLVQQVGPPELLQSTKAMLAKPGDNMGWMSTMDWPKALETGRENLRRAWKAGVTLVTGSDAGNPMVIHGPAVHRELQLWVQAGIPATVALQAATSNAARLVGAGNRIGLIQNGYEANLLLVDGNPLQDIGATERISMVMFKGERVNRPELFDPE